MHAFCCVAAGCVAESGALRPLLILIADCRLQISAWRYLQSTISYPLMPVTEMPSINVRWARKNRINTGATTMVLTAIRYG